ncbi:hypothetical protein [Kitasatospora sp. NPDC056181]|uniref:hypothetical protein n=1 Tax=Kitasatospora sp. NPDC056181 TaxID=3345737 RepID=UPI0035D87E23
MTALVVLALCGPSSIVGLLMLGAIRGTAAEADAAAAEQARIDAAFAEIAAHYHQEHRP